MITIVDVSRAQTLTVLDAFARLEVKDEVARSLEHENDRGAEVEVTDHLSFLHGDSAAHLP